jgi:hypothetical protein
MGNEQDRKFGKLPRVQVGFSRGRLVELNVATRTSERSGFSSKLCSSLPVGSIIRKDPRSLQDLVTVATVGQTRWRLPVTIEAVQDVSTRSVETGGGQARGVLYVGRGNSFTIKKGEHFLMVKIATEGGCRIEYEKRQYNVSSCPWLDGFRDHQEDFFKVVPGQARAERVSSVGLR